MTNNVQTPGGNTTTAGAVELLPCPFCGGDDVVPVCVYHPNGYAIGCVGCRAKGPIYKAANAADLPAEAIASWNAPHRPPSGVDVGFDLLLTLIKTAHEHGDVTAFVEQAKKLRAALTPSAAISEATKRMEQTLGAKFQPTASALSGDAGAAGPWMKVGTFKPEPDALYLVRGTLRTSVKRGEDIDADNVAAALIAALPSYKGAGE